MTIRHLVLRDHSIIGRAEARSAKTDAQLEDALDALFDNDVVPSHYRNFVEDDSPEFHNLAVMDDSESAFRMPRKLRVTMGEVELGKCFAEPEPVLSQESRPGIYVCLVQTIAAEARRTAKHGHMDQDSALRRAVEKAIATGQKLQSIGRTEEAASMFACIEQREKEIRQLLRILLELDEESAKDTASALAYDRSQEQLANAAE